MNDNIIIKYHGMTGLEEATEVKDYLDSLLRHSPSESTCHLHLFKEEVGYICKLTVHSPIKTFSSHSKDETIQKTVKTVLRDVRNQIAQWKNKRSSLELTGVSSVTRLNLKTLAQLEAEEAEAVAAKKAA